MDSSGQPHPGSVGHDRGDVQRKIAPSQLPSTQTAYSTHPNSTSPASQLVSPATTISIMNPASHLEQQHQYPPIPLLLDIGGVATTGRANSAATMPINNIGMETMAPAASVPPTVAMFHSAPLPQAQLQQQQQQHQPPQLQSSSAGSEPSDEGTGTSAATTPLLATKQHKPLLPTQQPTVPGPISVGSMFPTSKDLRVAVETSLMVNGRGLVCKPGGSRQKKFGCAGCGYVVRAVKSKGNGQWKISSVEKPDHPDCIGGRMRPSSKALLDVAGVFQADPSAPASAIWAQLKEQGITVNVRQVTRAKAIAEKRLRGIGSDSEGGSSGGPSVEMGSPAKSFTAGFKGGPKPNGFPRGPKRRRVVPVEVPDFSELDDDQVVQKAVEGAVELHRLEQALGEDHARAVRIRRKVVEQLSAGLAERPVLPETVSGLSGLPMDGMDFSRVSGKNCENVVGFVSLPVGIAGPLDVDGETVWVPLATTEGGLVASVNRGCRAISEGSYCGARTVVVDDGITRAPCIAMPNVRLALELKQWVERSSGPDAGFPVVFEAFQSTTQHGRLSSVKASLAGRYVYLRFKCMSGDAMGMNMVSKGCEAAVREVQRRFEQARLVALSGNMCTDKKPSGLNWTEGRGKSVVVEAILSASTVETVLKTSVDQMVQCNTAKNLVGSAMAGSIGGFNSHAANVVAAVFLATGQDPAHTVEGSHCITLMEEVRAGEEISCGGCQGDLRVSVTLPCLPVGTVGGGTDLPGQAACLKLAASRTAAPQYIIPADVLGEPPVPEVPRISVAEGNDCGRDSSGNETAGMARVSAAAAGGDSGGGESQRTAISLVAEAAAAAALAEAELAAAAISLLPGGGTAAAAPSSILPPSDNGTVTGETSVYGETEGEETTAREIAVETEPEPLAPTPEGGASASFCSPGTGARRLACVIGAAVLAGELSLLAALTTNDLVSAHMALNRKQQTAADGALSSSHGEAGTTTAHAAAASTTLPWFGPVGTMPRGQEGGDDAGAAGSSRSGGSSSAGDDHVSILNGGPLAKSIDGAQIDMHTAGMMSETTLVSGLTVQPSALQVTSAQGIPSHLVQSRPTVEQRDATGADSATLHAV